MPKDSITSEYWIVETDRKTGAITRLHDIEHNRELILNPSKIALILETDHGHVDRFQSLTSSAEHNKIHLDFSFHEGIVAHATITLEHDEVFFSFHVKNSGSREIRSLEYPILSGLTSFEDTDVLAHSYATGLLVERPTKTFNENMKGLRYAPYPESFSGSSMQFFAYYGKNSGFMMMAKDAKMHQKWLNIYHHENRLVASHIYGYEHMGRGKELSLPYELSIHSFEGDWMDAAEIYKAWAINQTFVPKPTLSRRHATWLYQDVGLSTFGINAKHDRRLWLSRYHHDLGLPVFHILGPDWTNHTQDFRGVKPGGLKEWVPTRFSKENLKEIKDQGDYVAPFEFDFLINPNSLDHKNIKPNMHVFPKPPKSHDGYTFNMLCPANQYTKDFHVKRDLTVLKESNVDSIYYDISANNLIKTCMSDEHDHDKGGGHEISDAYNIIYRNTKSALESHADRPIPLGAEMANEIHLKTLDYVQARSWAQPASTLETYPFRNLILEQKAEIIPLFTYVYHEYGLLRLDGWGKLVEEIGTLFYHTVAKTYLQGGLYEINHEYSPMEMIDGIENDSKEHYADFEKRGYPYRTERMSYIRQFAALRTKEGNLFLSYGKMIRPLPFTCKKTTFDYFHYNHTKENDTYEARGSITLDSVVHSAFERIDKDEIAYVFANTSTENETLVLSIPTGRHKKITMMSDFDPAQETKKRTMIKDKNTKHETLEVELGPRSLFMIVTSQ